MRQRDLKFFRRLLEGRKREILEEADRALLLRMRDRERKLLTKINEAFSRIESGDYGRCEECGDEIGIERLKARPVTTLCIGCKSAQEARERVGMAR